MKYVIIFIILIFYIAYQIVKNKVDRMLHTKKAYRPSLVSQRYAFLCI